MAERAIGMPTLWLTRTLPAAAETPPDRSLVAELEAAGWTVISLPVLAIIPRALSAADRDEISRCVGAAQWVLWTSVHAVAAFAGLKISVFDHLPEGALHAVGHRTAAAASQLVHRAVEAPPRGHGGAAWASGMRGRWKSGDRVVVFTGEDGRTSWQAAADADGVNVDCIPVYRRENVTVELPGHPPDAVIATSGAALQALSAAKPCALVRNCCLLLADLRLVEPARLLGWSGTMIDLADLTAASVLDGLARCCRA